MKINNSETSIASFVKNKDNFEDRENQALKILKDVGDLTSNELFEYIKGTFPENYRHNTHARLSGLRDKGFVYENGKRECRVTEECVIVWSVVPEGMHQQFRIKALHKKLKNAKALVAKIESAIEKENSND